MPAFNLVLCLAWWKSVTFEKAWIPKCKIGNDEKDDYSLYFVVSHVQCWVFGVDSRTSKIVKEVI